MEKRIALPIDKHRVQILDLINKNDVVIISSSTGSGKTTRVPQFIYGNHYAKRGNTIGLAIAITQPRRIAAIKSASRVADELGVSVGDGLVGYRISMDNNTTMDTPITFLTTGTLVQMLTHSKQRTRFTHILLDEVHLRDIYSDQLLLQIKLFQKQDPNWKPKIILLSATINISKFVDYFEQNDKDVGFLEIPNEERIYPIKTYFIDDLEKSTPEGIQVEGLANINLDRDTTNPNYDKITDLIWQLERLEDFGQGEKKGDVLIFLPGIGEIATLGDKIRLFNEKTKEGWIILEMHSNMPDEQQEALFEKPIDSNQRKIILATNIAESSITLKDVIYVIDFCMTKYMKYDITTTFTALVTDLSSHHQCIQRAGRAGRTEPGYCFRLVTRDFYDNNMKEESAPEMKMCGLGLAFLHLKELDMGSPTKLFASALDPPGMELIVSSVQCLKECGALTIYMKDGHYDHTDGELTTIGRLSTALACDPRQARLIAFGHIFGLLNESIVMAMSISTKSVFATFSSSQVKKGIDSFLKKIDIGGSFNSDAIASLGAYKLYLQNLKFGKRGWLAVMKQNYIRSAAIRNLDFAVARIHRKLETSNFHIVTTGRRQLLSIQDLHDSPHVVLKLKVLLAAAAYPNIFFRPVHQQQEMYIETINGELMGCNPNSSVILQIGGGGNNGNNNHYQNGICVDKKIDQDPPSFQQLLELKQQLSFNSTSTYTPNVMWNEEYEVIVVEYFPEELKQEDWIGNIALDVYKGLKFKALNSCYHLKSLSSEDNRTSSIINLKGPRSPISMNFSSYLTLYNKMQIEIDRDSVNQFTFDTCFPIPASYVLVSLQLAKKRKLVAKDSTLMPSIPGLFSHLHLIFAPTLLLTRQEEEEEEEEGREEDEEWEEDKKIQNEKKENQTIIPTCFVGGIAGLGCVNDEPIFSQHDAAIEFDVPIMQGELNFVNSIRKDLDDALDYDNFLQGDRHALFKREILFNKILGLMASPSHKKRTEAFSTATSTNLINKKSSTSPSSFTFNLFPPHKFV